MVTEALLTMLYNLACHILSILPSATFDVISPVTELAVIIQAISPFMPMTAFTVLIGVFVSVQVIKLGSAGLNWILRKFFMG